jgi:hypothetical protein
MSDIYKPPESHLARSSGGPLGGSVERTLLGDFSFDPVDLISEAFRQIYGVKGIILVGMLLGMIASGATGVIVQSAFGTAGVGLVLGNIAQVVVWAPFAGGLFWVSLRRVAGHDVAFEDFFTPFRWFVPLALASVLVFVLTFAGLVLLIVPGIYLAVAYLVTVPLIVDKGLTPWDALETSRRVVTRCWWRMFAVLLLIGVLVMVSGMLLVVPLIWTLPMATMVLALAYRNLCGVTGAAR